MVNTPQSPLIRWIPALLWAGWILRGSVDPSPDPPLFEIPHLDKIMHFVAWAILAALLRWALGRAANLRRAFWVSWAIAFGYGLAIEALQAPIATRSAEGLDLLADALGALLGAWLVGRRYP